MSCINVNSQEYIDILNEVGDPFDAHIEFIKRYGLGDENVKPGVDELFSKDLAQKIQDKLQKLYPEIKLNITNNPVWEKGDTIFNQEEFNNQVQYRLKAVEQLLSPKAEQLFKTLEKNKVIGDTFWKKVQELGISSNQIELLKSFNTTDREELITQMLANYSYTVGINTAKVSKRIQSIREIEPGLWNFRGEDFYSYSDAVDAKNEYNESRKELPTQHYSNLTVPGGTNYTENEIATPAITPSIKGHAQFATDQGIGWFRSDDRVLLNNSKQERILEFDEITGEVEEQGTYLEGEPELSKTRRILEVQSDLFQKGRNREDLVKKITGQEDIYESNDQFFVNGLNYYSDSLDGETITYFKGNDIKISYEEFRKAELQSKQEIKGNVKQNQFLQLLNKDNNWVTFFVKSIIQDSAKKGYEKVLFPVGDTAAKIEGHETVEEFIKNKEKRISNLNEQKIKIKDSNEIWTIKNVDPYSPGNISKIFSTSEEALNFIKNEEYPDVWSSPIRQVTNDLSTSSEEKVSKINNEIQQLEKEIEDAKIGKLKISSIANFYETTIFNILKKQGYEPKLVTDEYGNTWNEVTINQVRDLQNVLLQKNETGKIIGQANIKAMTVLVDAVNQKQDTLPHEYAHHYIAWFRNTPIVQEAIKKWGSEEALVQSIGEQVVKQKGEAYNWWNKFVKWIMNQFNSLSKLEKQELTQILTDAFLTRQDLNNIDQVKEGIDELFSSNPELASIGTPQLYSQYLDTIFPDSKVKDIVYHGTNVEFDKFDSSKGNWSNAIFFSFKQGDYKRQKEIKAVVNVINKFNIDEYIDRKYGKNTVKTIIEERYTGENNNPNATDEYYNLHAERNPDTDYEQFIKTETIKEYQKYGFDYLLPQGYLAVFKPEQIHILGSKQDIEGFKEFVSNQKEITETVSERPFKEAFDVYNKLLNETGEKPKSFEYNNGKYILNLDGTYDLTDPSNGNIFMSNIDIETGEIKEDPEKSIPLPQELKQTLLLQMINSKKNLPYEEMLAVKGYSYQDVFNSLVNAETMADYNNVLSILNKLC